MKKGTVPLSMKSSSEDKGTVPFYPSYLNLYETGELTERLKSLEALLARCVVCPRDCGTNRLRDEIGFCRAGYKPIVMSANPHFGEEPVLSGTRGAGTIFFGSCNMKCVYCQNFQISQNLKAKLEGEIEFETLADMMLALQEKGCHNIDLVSPSHFVPQIVRALLIAIPKGLHLPLVYNTNAYDSVEVLKLLDGIVDIYLPDLKYGENEHALKYSYTKNYVESAQAAIKEMHRQVGDLVVSEEGVAVRGLIVRHLVLPNEIAGSEQVLRFIARELGPGVAVSLMSQYFPTNRAELYPLISRKVRAGEYLKVLEVMEVLGFENGWAQEFESTETYRPDFESDAPFDNRDLGREEVSLNILKAARSRTA